MSHTAQPVKVIAEIGCNHKGEMDLAKELIQVAAKTCNADVAKFQKRHNRELLSPVEYDTPHPVPGNAYGDTYGAHREFLELDVDQHKDLISMCAEYGIKYSTSVRRTWPRQRSCRLQLHLRLPR